MILAWIRFMVAAGFLVLGLVFMALAVFGANRYKQALVRMHSAALGDTLGILFVLLGLMVLRGISPDTLKLSLVIALFWMASPVSGHMIARLEAMTDEDLGELAIIQGQEEKKGPEKEGKSNEVF
ncbi:MAG: monovalent cation/H(+) antiporter subunit G [Lachnospiraceae bacterium]|nr:monovalent cation/H(+) antiporter subunit G [Lachnospiraceae bacterium]